MDRRRHWIILGAIRAAGVLLISPVAAVFIIAGCDSPSASFAIAGQEVTAPEGQTAGAVAGFIFDSYIDYLGCWDRLPDGDRNEMISFWGDYFAGAQPVFEDIAIVYRLGTQLVADDGGDMNIRREFEESCRAVALDPEDTLAYFQDRFSDDEAAKWLRATRSLSIGGQLFYEEAIDAAELFACAAAQDAALEQRFRRLAERPSSQMTYGSSTHDAAREVLADATAMLAHDLLGAIACKEVTIRPEKLRDEVQEQLRKMAFTAQPMSRAPARGRYVQESGDLLASSCAPGRGPSRSHGG